MPMKRVAIACCLVAWLCGCKGLQSKVSDYPVLVHVADDLGKPLANVQLSAAGKPLGATEVSGERSLSLPGIEGQRVALKVVCPPGYAAPHEPPAVVFKSTQNPQTPGLQAIELSVTCAAKERVSLIAIRTGQPNVPVMLRGQAVALTSTTGTAKRLAARSSSRWTPAARVTCGQRAPRTRLRSRNAMGLRSGISPWSSRSQGVRREGSIKRRPQRHRELRLCRSGDIPGRVP
jgi:hypothetical protein